jgi:hypothetical protein
MKTKSGEKTVVKLLLNAEKRQNEFKINKIKYFLIFWVNNEKCQKG